MGEKDGIIPIKAVYRNNHHQRSATSFPLETYFPTIHLNVLCILFKLPVIYMSIPSYFPYFITQTGSGNPHISLHSCQYSIYSSLPLNSILIQCIYFPEHFVFTHLKFKFFLSIKWSHFTVLFYIQQILTVDRVYIVKCPANVKIMTCKRKILQRSGIVGAKIKEKWL
jgi:hypothetical protein